MYKIEKKDYGFKLTFGDVVDANAMKNWVAESKVALIGAGTPFGVFVDMRTLKPLDSATQSIMEEGQKLFKAKGMQRSVVILDNLTVALQFKRLAKESGIYTWERYIGAQSRPDWEKTGIAWIKDAVDPDK